MFKIVFPSLRAERSGAWQSPEYRKVPCEYNGGLLRSFLPRNDVFDPSRFDSYRIVIGLFLFLLLPTLLFAQTDTTCASQGESGYKACLLPKEAGWIKPAANIASRKRDTLYIKLLNGKKLSFANELYNPDSQAVDTSRTYIFIKSHKNKYATVLRIARDGNTFLLIDLATGEQKGFDGLPQFSPSMNRILCVSGSQHSPFSPEIATVWKRTGKFWRQEYKSEPKALEGYGTGKWTSDNRITLRKMDWEKSSGGKPKETETVLLYEFEEWRRVGK